MCVFFAKNSGSRIQLAYGRSNLTLQYEDEEGDKITIDKPEMLESALKVFHDSNSIRHGIVFSLFTSFASITSIISITSITSIT